jgi:hypothetical protein
MDEFNKLIEIQDEQKNFEFKIEEDHNNFNQKFDHFQKQIEKLKNK